jgi:diaminopropionate ammonia-lyase
MRSTIRPRERDPRIAPFHRRMPGYAPSALFDAPRIASALDVGRVLVKAETQRFGLPSFKVLGASWATYRAVCDRLGHEPEPWPNVTSLAAALKGLRPLTLVAATDGNHGRAVAHMARLLGFSARIFVPVGTAIARVEAIRSEGAAVTIVDGDYDTAVARAAAAAGHRSIVISDTSWPGYETTPCDVIEGYRTIFEEVDDALTVSAAVRPDVVVLPVGVGALMAAAVHHYRAIAGEAITLVGVEPDTANCLQVSVEHGRPTPVPGPHPCRLLRVRRRRRRRDGHA